VAAGCGQHLGGVGLPGGRAGDPVDGLGLADRVLARVEDLRRSDPLFSRITDDAISLIHQISRGRPRTALVPVGADLISVPVSVSVTVSAMCSTRLKVGIAASMKIGLDTHIARYGCLPQDRASGPARAISADICVLYAGPVATVRDGRRRAASADRSRHGEHPSAIVSVAETLIGRACQQPSLSFR
jgi:hypothetical protein